MTRALQEGIIPPNTPSPGVVVAFIKVAGAPVELLQIDRTIRRDLGADGHGCGGTANQKGDERPLLALAEVGRK